MIINIAQYSVKVRAGSLVKIPGANSPHAPYL